MLVFNLIFVCTINFQWKMSVIVILAGMAAPVSMDLTNTRVNVLLTTLASTVNSVSIYMYKTSFWTDLPL